MILTNLDPSLIFSNLVSFSPRNSNFSIKKNWLCAVPTVSYFSESKTNLILDLNCKNEKFSPLFKIIRICIFLWHFPFKCLCNSFKKWLLTLRSIEWLPAASYCAKLGSTARSWKTQLGEICTKIKNILTHYRYSVAKADSNYVKKNKRKSHLTSL